MMTAMTPVQLIPLTLKDAPALIETVFPAQKVSFEAQRERKAVQSQTLTGLGSYWKGRKPLILVRAIILGSLLPKTESSEADLAVFEALMGFDLEGLSRRAVEQSGLSCAEIASRITLKNPWDYFDYRLPEGSELRPEDVDIWWFPLDVTEKGLRISWKRTLSDEAKAEIYAKALATFSTYEERSLLCKRPEEVDLAFLLAPALRKTNQHLASFGVNASSLAELIEQLGILRFGHRPKVGDTFAGGGSIPFEAARIGCDAYASDLNPVACMLTWGAFNIVGAEASRRAVIEAEQERVAAEIDEEISALGIEHDNEGNRAKAYLYCSETICPETGWLVPMSPTWVISKTRNAVAKLVPDPENKRFNIVVQSGVSAQDMREAEKGTIREGRLVYTLDGKTYATSIKTLRGDYRTETGETANRLRPWGKSDFRPIAGHDGDVFQERLYAIQWITKSSLHKARKITFFAGVTPDDLLREKAVEDYVSAHLADWQASGLMPDMGIEHGFETTRLYRERGWSHWHHLFNPRCLLTLGITKKHILQSAYAEELLIGFAKQLDWLNKGCYFGTGAARESISHMFSNQALNVLWNFGIRSAFSCYPIWAVAGGDGRGLAGDASIVTAPAHRPEQSCDLWVTDPPYADAVHYHEITEFFIAWLRNNKPVRFNEWTWDSRRAMAIKGSGDDFRRGMIDAYTAMANHMPDNGMQCVMFTHQSTEVWSDMVGIFWAAGLQVMAAWYIATETTSDLKKGGYVQGTVTLMLRKRPAGERVGFKSRLLPLIRKEVSAQIEQMMHLNDEARASMGEPVFNDADLQMAGVAAALKVLTTFTKIGDTDVATFALRPRARGEVTVVDEIVEQAVEAANSLLVPEGIQQETWQALSGVQRFYLRMLDMESVGASKLDNYQNFAKAFRVEDYTKVMESITANAARLLQPEAFTSRDLSDSGEFGPTWLGNLVLAIQQLLTEVSPQAVVDQLRADLPDYFEARDKLVELAKYLSVKCLSPETRQAAEVLASRMQNQRFGDYEG